MKNLTLFTLIVFTLTLFPSIPAFPDNPPTSIEASYSFVNNKLKNPGFEQGLYGWTASVPSTMTLEKTASLVDDGIASLKFVSTASGQTVTGNAIPLVNTTGVASSTTLWTTSCRFQTSNTDYLMQAVDQSGNVLSSQITTDTVPSSTNYTRYTLSYYLPSGTTSVAPRIKSQSAGTVHVDKCYTGPAEGFNASNVQNGYQWVGSIKITGCSANFTTSSTTFADFSAGTGCIYTPTGTGISSPSGGTWPGLGLTGKAGRYKFEFIGGIIQGTTGNITANLEFYDGSQDSEMGFFESNSSGNNIIPMFSASLTESTAPNNLAVRMRGFVTSGGALGVYANNGEPAVINVYWMPTTADSATSATFSNTPASWSGYIIGSGGGWNAVTSTGNYTDYAVATTSSTATQLTSRNMTCTAESTKLPAITCSIGKVGIYHVCAHASIGNSTSTAGTFAALVEGAPGTYNFIDPGNGMSTGSANGYGAFNLCGDYSVPSTGNHTFRIVGEVSAGSGFINQTAGLPISWTVKQNDAPSGAVTLVGHQTPVIGTPVTSAISGLTNTAWACATGGPTVTITANKTGTYKVVGGVTAANQTASAGIYTKIGVSSGSPVELWNQAWETSNTTAPENLYALYTLSSGQTYTFCIDEKVTTSSTATLYCDVADMQNGCNVVVEDMN